jgi:hypothetical protein
LGKVWAATLPRNVEISGIAMIHPALGGALALCMEANRFGGYTASIILQCSTPSR